MALIPRPDLDLRNEEEFAAQAISRTLELCPELTNANVFAPHTVIIETLAWMLGQIGYRINQVPDLNLIEFARLFGIELRAATKAMATLRFTVAAPVGTPVTIPANTHIATEDNSIVFVTTEQVIIPANTTTGNVPAENLVVGHISLASNQLTNSLDNVTHVIAVTNLNEIDSGTEEETVESALARMRQYQRRAERLVTTQDLEDAILDEALNGNGIVRAFPFVEDGDFDSHKVGRTTVIVMTQSGEVLSDSAKKIIADLVSQMVGNQWIYLHDPAYVNFNVTANIRLRSGATETATLNAIKTNIEKFYAPRRENFGRDILRAEIIAVIEGTEGVDRIVSQPSGSILSAPISDVRLKAWELPRPQTITINVV